MQMNLIKSCLFQSSFWLRLAALSSLFLLGGCADNWGWYVVNPATAAYACSFVELVTPDGEEGTATPQWFVSHWWGEPVLDFIKCTQEHARVRELGRDACYWVCACPLHRPKTAGTPRPSKSSNSPNSIARRHLIPSKFINFNSLDVFI